MEEEQHHHHYGGGAGSSCSTPAMADLRQFFSPTPTHHHQFPPPPPSLYSPAAAAFPHHYDTMMLVMGAAGPGVHDFRSDNSAGCAAATAAMVPASSSAGGFDMENAAGAGGGFGLGDGGATARWPRQETLTLLEIRSRLDHKFKEANHKGPLWDEVSRIMCEEHGYQRSGKKCREKFENLYKYYKKTKEGKAGRQDGKHYRFFRQLEALYGEQPPPNPPSAHLNLISSYTPAAATPAVKSTSLSNTSSDLDTSSSEGGAGSMDGDSDMVGRRSRKRRGWKARIKEFIDAQMRRIVEKQEAWLERMMRSLEHREEERVAREEEWRRQEAARMEREHRFWAKERAWIEARDKALMEALHRITGSSHEEGGSRWGESEMVKLVELRASVQERFDECGGGPGEGGLWDEISTRMACLGHDRSARMCRDKWDFISKELSEKRKEADRNTKYHHLQTTNLLYNYGTQDMNGQVGPPQIGLGGGGGGGGGNPMNDSCLRILLGDGGGETNPWESYGVKLTKGDQTH